MWSIVNKEYRQRARGVATVGLIITYTLILSGVAFFVYLASYTSQATGLTSAGQVGRGMCIATFITQMVMALMLSLSLNASTIAAEKDQETFDLLNLTLFRSWEIVLGKFISSTGFLFVLVVTAVPIYTLAFTFGGVSLDYFWRLAVVVVGTTLFISSLGLLMSLISDDLRTALGRSFLIIIVVGAVSGILGGMLVDSFQTAPPNVISYWLGALSILVNPIWSAIDVFTPLTLSWPTPQPAFIPHIVGDGLWGWTAAVQCLIAALILTLTTLVYPRFRASRMSGVAG